MLPFVRIDGFGENLTGFDVSTWHTGWKVHQVKEKSSDWDAIVPGDVRQTLVRENIIPDPLKGTNNKQCAWVAHVPWEYHNIFESEPITRKTLQRFPEGGIVHVVFEGIDYDADFFIQDQPVCRQIGMFSPVHLITNVTPKSTPKLISIPFQIRFNVQPWWRTHAVKSQMAFGWDFAPEIPTIGIWKPVHVYNTGPAFFTEMYVIAKFGEIQNEDASAAQINGRFVVKVVDPNTLQEMTGLHPIKLHITALGLDTYYECNIQSGMVQTFNIPNINLALWFPHNHGTPTLIPIIIDLEWNHVITDRYHGEIINRSVKLVRNPHTPKQNEPWTFEINKKKIFVRGINWVPPDSLSGRIDADRYQRLIRQAKDFRIDMFRVWGGGIEEKTEFFDECNKAGIMVWQEFPFACTNYPRDKKYINIVRTECESIIKRSRRHPATAVYCGGNEFNPYINAHIVDLLQNLVQKHAPDHYFYKVSPFLGDDHNWKVWGAGKMWDAYERDFEGTFQMLTEFGMQAAPSLSTLKMCIDNESSSSLEDVKKDLEYHRSDVNNHRRYARRFAQSIENLPTFIHVSQTLQAFALKYAIEGCRARWPNVSGVFPWQFSDPWPNTSWSIIDYNFQPKLGAKMVKCVYTDILPIIRNWKPVKHGSIRRTADLIVHNASIHEFKGRFTMEITRKNPNHSQSQEEPILEKKSVPIVVFPSRPLRIGTVEVDAIPGTIVRTMVFDNTNRKVGWNIHFPAMEPVRSWIHKWLDKLDVHFDGWWRMHMTSLMELDRIRSDVKDWNQKKQYYTELRKKSQ